MSAVETPDGFGPASGLGGRPSLGMSERVYAGLLRAYPAAFRTRYRDEMVVLFGDQLRDARSGRGTGGVAATWTRTLADLVKSAIGEHLRREGTVGESLATFEPTRSMRLLGAFGILGGALLLWAFISFNPFVDPAINRARLVIFGLAGAAIAVAFHRRQALAAPTLALLTTAAVVIAGIWYAMTVIIAQGVDNPFIGPFGLVNLFANLALWITPAAWSIGMLHTGSAWQGMSPGWRLATKLGLASLIGSAVAWLGDDRLGMIDSLWGDLWLNVVVVGVVMNGLGWIVLGAVLLVGGRRAAPPAVG